MRDWAAIRECMKDAGCSAAAVERAERLCQSGEAGELIRCLRECRCDALEELHEKQKQLDRLDMLIRDTRNMKRSNCHESGRIGADTGMGQDFSEKR